MRQARLSGQSTLDHSMHGRITTVSISFFHQRIYYLTVPTKLGDAWRSSRWLPAILTLRLALGMDEFIARQQDCVMHEAIGQLPVPQKASNTVNFLAHIPTSLGLMTLQSGIPTWSNIKAHTGRILLSVIPDDIPSQIAPCKKELCMHKPAARYGQVQKADLLESHR